MGRKKLHKKVKKLETRLKKLETKSKPVVNVIGYQQTLRNESNDNDYDDCGEISWVEANK